LKKRKEKILYSLGGMKLLQLLYAEQKKLVSCKKLYKLVCGIPVLNYALDIYNSYLYKN